jgi:HSP20 family protein
MAREQAANREQSQAVEERRGGGMSRRESQRATLPAMLTPFRLMDSLINQMLGGDSSLRRLESFFPQVDMVAQNGKLVIRADLPGVDVDDVRVIMTDNSVIIEGEREDEREQEDTRMYRYERTYGHFRREIPLLEGTSTENVNATFKNGVLEITLDMPEASQSQREIPIQKEQTTGESGQSSQPTPSGQTGEQGTQRQQPGESGETGKQGKSKQPEEKAA